MATLTVQDVARTGLNPSYDSADVAGDEFINDGNTILHAKNGDASSKTVTITSYADTGVGLTTEDISVTIPAGEERMIGPLPKSAYNDTNNKAQVSYDAVTSVTVAAISLGDTIVR